jgi:ribonuclease P/MRP protein subunit POP8
MAINQPSKTALESKRSKSTSDPMLQDDASPTKPHPANPSAKKGKSNASRTHHLATLRSPAWTYFHLHLYTLSPSASTSASATPLDALTVRRHMTAALSRFLGLTGTAIPLDILKLDADHVWIRVPRLDAVAVHEALASWVGEDSGGQKWVVKGRSDWLITLVAGHGQELFGAKG